MVSASDMAQRRALARSADDPDYRARRAELIEAAARVFRRKGFQAANLRDIAREVGKDRASLYYYTTGKEELFEEVVAKAAFAHVRMIEQLRVDDAPSRVKLRSLIVSLMESYEAHYPYLFVYIQEPMAHLDDSTEWNRHMLDLQHRFKNAVRGIIEDGLADGSIQAAVADARLIAYAIIGMCTWSHRWFQPDRGESAAPIGSLFADIVLDGLGCESLSD